MPQSSGRSSYRTVELPSAPAPTDGQVTHPDGFTSLTLPRAAVSAEDARGLDLFSGHVDLAKSGRAQVTMGTISIIKGAAMVSKTPPTTLGRSTSRLRRLSRSFTSSSNKGKEAETPARLQSGVEHALAFTTSTSTPSKYGPSQMIVKIIDALPIALDRIDKERGRVLQSELLKLFILLWDSSKETPDINWGADSVLIALGRLIPVPLPTPRFSRQSERFQALIEYLKERRTESGFVACQLDVAVNRAYGYKYTWNRVLFQDVKPSTLCSRPVFIHHDLP
ncbi:hypothetical protein M407DRAFT_21683 [Tulasnella calospora MUT 4182]|uniref:Uncharacterized protein n=1 Tax=Tulasnella calospora MUT 4182 TaxID=1051891 RepID=A0A0C3QPA1_9AGAM|nr:hypothetical protein M407DRAFT_21683 [Tulasnella calospora MUT 4182]